MSASQRRKGARWEVEVTRWLAAIWPAAHRTRTPGQHEDRGDVGGTPYTVEVKDQQTISLPAWFRQAESAARLTAQTPVLIIKRKGCPDPADSYVVMRGADWLNMHDRTDEAAA